MMTHHNSENPRRRHALFRRSPDKDKRQDNDDDEMKIMMKI
jgi:hypothetical protein